MYQIFAVKHLVFIRNHAAYQPHLCGCNKKGEPRDPCSCRIEMVAAEGSARTLNVGMNAARTRSTGNWDGSSSNSPSSLQNQPGTEYLSRMSYDVLGISQPWKSWFVDTQYGMNLNGDLDFRIAVKLRTGLSETAIPVITYNHPSLLIIIMHD